MPKQNKKSKPEFEVEITARFTHPDKKEKMRIEMDVKHGTEQTIDKYVGNLRRIPRKKIK
jgi:hypothetical protein